LLTRNGNAAIKLAPATAAPPEWRRPAELEWFGSRGECRQQVAWFGKLVRRPGERSATVVGDRGAASIAGTGAEPLPVATELGRYLYEPQAAVLAAGLSGALAARHGLAALTAGVAYLTGDQRHDGPLLSAFEVHDILPFDAKQLKAYCRQRNLGRLELKKRGLEIDLEKLRRQVIGRGENAATLLISPWQGKVRVFVAERMS
jgi:hypothetical protein